MAEHSKIEWTHHTFNPWWGCAKVSPACEHCYAETWAKRVGQDVWGKRSDRRFFSDRHWSEPLRWDRQAESQRKRARVFCASMADVFEDRRDLDGPRARLWDLIERTRNLDWLLLTKRPELVGCLAPWGNRWPRNVWLGTTAEDQRRANDRVPMLLGCPAAVRFLSCEPLLSQIDLTSWISEIDWVIAGGESGAKARPMQPEWLRGVRDLCVGNGVAFHFKQWELPVPGSSLRQRMFALSLFQAVASGVSSEIPTPAGPRQCGQSPGAGRLPHPWTTLKHAANDSARTALLFILPGLCT